MDSSLDTVDELLHIGRRMRPIALQSAVGGMALSVVGMAARRRGHTCRRSAGAVLQEVIDLVAVLNALRAAVPGGPLERLLSAAAALGPTLARGDALSS